MTSTQTFRERNRDIQDLTERHIYEDIEYVSGAGSVVKVKGTGTEDQEAPVISLGYGMRLPKGANAEVLLIGLGSDTGLKFALVNLPADKQREWKEGTGGVQNPMDPSHALEFKDGQLHLTKGTLSVGDGGTIEVKDGQIYIRGNVSVTGTMTVNGGVITPNVSPGTDPNIPVFSA